MAIFLKKNLEIKEKIKDQVDFIEELDISQPYVKVGILNLMPTLEDTERQLIMALDNPVVQIELDFIYLNSKNKTEEKTEYFKKYYTSFKDIKDKYYDGVLVTGAPLEHLNYSSVDYIEELKEFFKYTKTNVKSTIFLCWASQFGMQYFYGVNRMNLPNKLSGLYEHYILQATNLVKGFDDIFFIPQSRYCSLIENDIMTCDDLILTSKSNDAGVYIVESRDGSKIFLTGHAEYDVLTLDKEYRRDINKGLDILPPKNYYKDDNPDNEPIYKWHSHATLLYHNWIYYYVYRKKLDNLK